MPGYVTPPTAVAGQPLSAADWNTKVRDSMESIARPYRARVARNTSLAIASGAVTMLPFQIEHHDSDELWVAGSPSRLTVPANAGGIWRVGFTFIWSINAAGGRHAGLYVNGVMYTSDNAPGSAGWYIGMNAECDIYAAAGSYFEVGVFQSSGANVNVDITYPCAFWARRVAA